MKETIFLGVPFNAGQSRPGTAAAPDYFRHRFLPADWQDLGNVMAPGYRGLDAAIQHALALSETLSHHSLKNRFLAIVGGDHGQGLGTVHGLLHHYSNLIVVWIDAHADANVPSASPTGNMHGMPLSWLLGAREGRPWWLKRTLSPRQLVYVGARDLDPYEQMLLQELDISVIKPQETDFANALRRELDRLDPEGKCPVLVSLDVDALDASLVPSTGTPVRDGLTHAQIETAIDVIQEERNIVAMEIVEINPELGTHEETQALMTWARDVFRKVSPRNDHPRPPWQIKALKWWD